MCNNPITKKALKSLRYINSQTSVKSGEEQLITSFINDTFTFILWIKEMFEIVFEWQNIARNSS